MVKASARQQVIYKDLGKIPFKEAWDLQTKYNKRLVDAKRGLLDNADIPHYFLFCEHHPVYTLGKSGSEQHLKVDAVTRGRLGVEYFKINRGGDITFHGPGQVVGYPIFDLDRFFTDIHKYVRYLEEAIIRLLAEYGLEGQRLSDFTGVWLMADSGEWRKICAIGVHLSRWVTMHGFAMNVNTNLDYFNYIVPCGIDAPDKNVTSLAAETGVTVPLQDVRNRLKRIFAELFEYDYVTDPNPDNAISHGS